MDLDLAVEAARYLNAGFEVIALVGKQPNTDYHQHGLTDAISGTVESDEDRATLLEVFGGRTTGIGLLIPEHVLVADVDSEDAATVLRGMYPEGTAFPETPTSLTPNGLHVWYWAPGARGSLWVADRKLLLRGRGSYVAAPPSLHPSGVRYRWAIPLEGMGPFEPIPEGIERVLRDREAVAAATPERPESEKWVTEVRFGPLRIQKGFAIDGLVRSVAETKEGNRNNILAWAAMTAAEDGVPLTTAKPALMAAAKKSGLDEREARTTINQAYRRAARG